MNIPSGDLAASALSHVSNEAVLDNKNADLTRGQSEGSSGVDSGSVRTYGITSGDPDSAFSGPSSHLSSSRLQYDVPEADDIRVAGARTPYIDPIMPLGNGIGQRVLPEENSYKAAASSDDVVSDNSGDATGEEEDLFSNVSPEDRQTLENLAFDMDVYATNVIKPETLEGQERDVTDVDATVPHERDGSYVGDKSAEPTELADDEEDMDVVNGDSQNSARQIVNAPEESIPPARDEVKAANTEIPTGRLFCPTIVN